ncbi:MAG: hypothetical protein AB8B85_19960 [Paracoccaceae bacterium]
MASEWHVYGVRIACVRQAYVQHVGALTGTRSNAPDRSSLDASARGEQENQDADIALMQVSTHKDGYVPKESTILNSSSNQIEM